MFNKMSVKSSLDYDSKRDIVEGVFDLGEDGRRLYPATHVLLFMIRGLTYKWKMPLAYFASNNLLNASVVAKLLPKCIGALQDLGLKVRAVVCDQSSVNRKAAMLLEINNSRPYFKSNNQKIYFIYDFPHILKCVRNNFMKIKDGHLVGQISFSKTPSSDDQEEITISNDDSEPKACGEVNGQVLKSGISNWSHLEMLYHIDRRATKSRATKLTDSHLKPNSFEKMSVKLATQVFSMSVSAAMRTVVETGELPSAALNTAYFLERMNNMFDIMNSKTKCDPNPYKCVISSSENSHLQTPLITLENDIKWAKSLKLSSGIRPPCMVSMEHSILATRMLWDDMKQDGAKYLLTGRINQDPIENEFSIARQKCGFERNPSIRWFRQNLRHRIQAALVQPPTGANCEPDEDELLSAMTESTQPFTHSGSGFSTSPAYPTDDFEDTDTDTDNDWENASTVASLESCFVRYFAGYGIRCRKFRCTECEGNLLKSFEATDSPHKALIRNKEYNSEGCSLLYPTDESCAAVETVLTVLDNTLKRKIHMPWFKKHVVKKCKQRLFYSHPQWMKGGTTCYEHREFIINKIVIAKLKRTLQAISKDLRQPGGKYGGYWEKITKIQNK